MKSKKTLRILHVCSEVFPGLKTGGLADVTGALPPELKKLGCDVRLLVPGFPALIDHIQNKHLVAEFAPRFGAYTLQLFYGTLPQSGIAIYYINAPGLYDRPGNPYIDIHGQSYGDNHRRFALLGWMAARLVEGFDYFWRPNILHGHDWHSGLAFAYLKVLEQTAGKKLAGTVFTIHNMAYQGNFPEHLFYELDLPHNMFNSEEMEFYNQVSFLKTALVYADKITTVSPTYAKEIQGEEQSCGLGGVIQKRSKDLVGILNGIDVDIWNPSTDPTLVSTYNAKSITLKKQCRHAIQKEMKLALQDSKPLFCIVSRFASQKGLNLVLNSINKILENGGQLIVIGNGEHYLEQAFLNLSHHYPQQIATWIGYNEPLAHQVIAGSDVIIVPSRYEPCGLTQLYGLRYGTLPLVHRVGGLADSVTNSTPENINLKKATGFTFDHFDVLDIQNAIDHVFELFTTQKEWKKVQRQGMKQKLGWKHSAKEYKKLYKEIKI